jgi:hypothetical protein
MRLCSIGSAKLTPVGESDISNEHGVSLEGSGFAFHFTNFPFFLIRFILAPKGFLRGIAKENLGETS